MKNKETPQPSFPLDSDALCKEVSELLELTHKTHTESTALLDRLIAVSEKANELGTNEIELESALLQHLNEFVLNAEKRCLCVKQHLDTIKRTFPLC